MIVTPVKTHRIGASESIYDVLDSYLPLLKEDSVVIVTSKIVSLCENRLVPFTDANLEEIVKQEADYYLPSDGKDYNYRFTIIRNTLTLRAGIDKSTKRGSYILWPDNPQKSANSIREHLVNRLKTPKIGVVLTDSISSPLRRGVAGISIAHSGFRAINDYKSSRANIANGLAAAAVVAMGEGNELTPLAVITDASFIQFQSRNPSQEELKDLYVPMSDDIFGSFLRAAPWIKKDP
jgi:F420-0:gamma-glutamyl ligase